MKVLVALLIFVGGYFWYSRHIQHREAEAEKSLIANLKEIGALETSPFELKNIEILPSKNLALSPGATEVCPNFHVRLKSESPFPEQPRQNKHIPMCKVKIQDQTAMIIDQAFTAKALRDFVHDPSQVADQIPKANADFSKSFEKYRGQLFKRFSATSAAELFEYISELQISPDVSHLDLQFFEDVMLAQLNRITFKSWVRAEKFKKAGVLVYLAEENMTPGPASFVVYVLKNDDILMCVNPSWNVCLDYFREVGVLHE